MLIVAEGTIHEPIRDQSRSAASAWLGPMTDSGMFHGGWIDEPGQRLWMVLSASDLDEAQERLDTLPPVSEGSVSFKTCPGVRHPLLLTNLPRVLAESFGLVHTCLIGKVAAMPKQYDAQTKAKAIRLPGGTQHEQPWC